MAETHTLITMHVCLGKYRWSLQRSPIKKNKQRYKQHKEKGVLKRTIKHPKNAMCENGNS